MAGDPTVAVKRRYAAVLADLMPTATDGDGPVPVFYSFPGDTLCPREAVWLHGARTVIEQRVMRAQTRRRDLTVEFDVIVQVIAAQESEESDPSESPQAAADERAFELLRIIDEQIATEEHLGCPDLVDVARLTGTRLEYGLTDLGNGSRIVATVSFDARVI
jgi:hypothetical protein